MHLIKKIISKIPLYYLLIIEIIIVILRLTYSEPEFSNITIQEKNSNVHPYDFSFYHDRTHVNDTFIIRGNARFKRIGPAKMAVYADDCIIGFTVDSIDVLKRISEGSYCIDKRHEPLSIRRTMGYGNSFFEITAVDYGGGYGVNFKPYKRLSYVLSIPAFGIIMLLILYVLIEKDNGFMKILQRAMKTVKRFFRYITAHIPLSYLLVVSIVLGILLILLTSKNIFPGLSTENLLVQFFIYLLIFIPITVFGFQVLKNRGRVILFLFILGIITRVFYFTHTNYNERTHDAVPHFEYIDYLAEHNKLPPPTGWETHQPPVYYLLAAIPQKITTWLGYNDVKIKEGNKALNLIIAIASIIISLFVIDSFFKTSIEKFMAGLMIILSPSLLFSTTRVGNDSIVFFTTAFSVYLFMQWYKNPTWRNAIYLGIMVGMALLSKLNAITLGSLFIFPLVYYATHGGGLSGRVIKQLITIGILVFSISGWFYIRSYVVYELEDIKPGKELLLDNSLQNYTTFKPKEILNRPFANTHSDAAGRRNFWEFVYKTHFFGEWYYAADKFMLLQQLIMLTGFLVLAVIMTGMFFYRDNMELYFINMLLLLFTVGLLLSFRYYRPYASNQDFRYILPALLPLSFFFSKGMVLIGRIKYLSIKTVLYFIVFLNFLLVFIFQLKLMSVDILC